MITFTEAELKGVPKDIISGYTKRTQDGEGVYDVTYKTPDIFPIVNLLFLLNTSFPHSFPQFKFAENPETRRRALEGYESRLEMNVPILSKALDLRRKIATLLGYKTWLDSRLYVLWSLMKHVFRADYITEEKMVKSGKNVDDVSIKLLPTDANIK